jgi:hypothetical protein
MPREHPSMRGMRTCPTCLAAVGPGFAYKSHVRECTLLAGDGAPPPQDGRDADGRYPPYLSDEGGGMEDDGGDDGANDVDNDTDDDDVANGPGVSAGDGDIRSSPLFNHLQNQEHRHLDRYLSWGARPLSPKDEEVLRFLAVVDGGGGMSRASGDRVLQYARSMGGRALHLPKRVSTCWDRLERVVNPPIVIANYLPSFMQIPIANFYCNFPVYSISNHNCKFVLQFGFIHNCIFTLQYALQITFLFLANNNCNMHSKFPVCSIANNNCKFVLQL